MRHHISHVVNFSACFTLFFLVNFSLRIYVSKRTWQWVMKSCQKKYETKKGNFLDLFVFVCVSVSMWWNFVVARRKVTFWSHCIKDILSSWDKKGKRKKMTKKRQENKRKLLFNFLSTIRGSTEFSGMMFSVLYTHAVCHKIKENGKWKTTRVMGTLCVYNCHFLHTFLFSSFHSCVSCFLT